MTNLAICRRSSWFICIRIWIFHTTYSLQHEAAFSSIIFPGNGICESRWKWTLESHSGNTIAVIMRYNKCHWSTKKHMSRYTWYMQKIGESGVSKDSQAANRLIACRQVRKLGWTDSWHGCHKESRLISRIFCRMTVTHKSNLGLSEGCFP